MKETCLPGAEEDEENHEHETVHAVVHVGHSGLLHRHEGRGRQGGRQHDEQSHEGGDGGVLQLEDVPPEQALQLVVLEPETVHQPRKRHLQKWRF